MLAKLYPSFQRLIPTKTTFRALQNRNYKLFYFAQITSSIGNWMQKLALGWLVYKLTKSGLYLGVINFLELFPLFIITPFAGVIIDRLNKQRLFITTQILALILTGTLAVMVLTNTINITVLIILGCLEGLVDSIDIPTRQAFLPEMLDKQEDIQNAIALNGSIVHFARLTGPAISGLLIKWVGIGYCFLINTFSFIPVIIALMLMQITPKNETSKKHHFFTHFKEGYQYAFQTPPIRTLILSMAFLSLLVMPFAFFMPVFSKEVLHGDAQTLGFLMGSAGAGALVSSITLANRDKVTGMLPFLLTSCAIYSIVIISLGFSTQLWTSMGLLFLTGYFGMSQIGGINILLQSILEEDKRGRVMSLYTTAFLGIFPFGSLVGGALVHQFGVTKTFMICGFACALLFVWWLFQYAHLKKAIHCIHIKKGIIPDPSTEPYSEEMLETCHLSNSKP